MIMAHSCDELLESHPTEKCGWSNYRWWNYGERESERKQWGKWRIEIKMSLISFAICRPIHRCRRHIYVHVFIYSAIHVDWKCQVCPTNFGFFHRNGKVGHVWTWGFYSTYFPYERLREQGKFMTSSACSL